MAALDDMDQELRDRDAQFVESNLGRRGGFSEAQKKWCGDLIKRYGHHLPRDWRVFYVPQPNTPPPRKETQEDDMLGAALS